MKRLIVFSDLDGTLLDHNTYSFTKALPAIERLRKNKIPLIFTSSKTMAEILVLRDQMDNHHSFIAENGAVLAIPEQYSEKKSGKDCKGYRVEKFGRDRGKILEFLQGIRKMYGYNFTGFSDMAPDELCRHTGLDRESAARAADRLCTEPLLWQDSAEAWQLFLGLLEENGLSAAQGGRFVCISDKVDKKDGVKRVKVFYSSRFEKKVTTMALGDSPNDIGMLNAVDIAVVIRSSRSDTIHPDKPGTVYRTKLKGPEGWQEAMDKLLSRYTALEPGT